MSAARPFRRRLHRDLVDVLGPLDGARLPGGCEHCDAYQTVENGGHAGLWILNVHHDQGCPFLARVEALRG